MKADLNHPRRLTRMLLNLSRIVQRLFAAGRFLGTALILFIPPRWFLSVALGGCIITAALLMNEIGATGVAIYPLDHLFEVAFLTLF